MMRTGTTAGLALLLLAAAPAPRPSAPPPDELVLNCYVAQSGDLSIGQFVRHLVVIPSRQIVTVADGLGGAPPQFIGNAKLVTLDANHLVFDFASPRSAGRTEIDLRTGTMLYQGGRAVVRGTCQRSEL